MFDDFIVARYRITIVAGADGLDLPAYKGSAIRGCFGVALRQTVCVVPGQECDVCIVREKCCYRYLFETNIGDALPLLENEYTNRLKAERDAPRPYVIEPPLETKEVYHAGEKLTFYFVLIGRAIDYLSYCVLTFQNMGRVGLGKGKRPFTLHEVAAVGLHKSVVIFSSGLSRIVKTDLSFNGNELLDRFPRNINKLRIEFETSARHNDSGRITPVPEFHLFFRQAMRRISALYDIHQGCRLDADFKGLSERAKNVVLQVDKTRWESTTGRVSQRQNKKINLAGFVGIAVYEGGLDDFIPWLALGEVVHVGKGAVFGLGKYRIISY